MVLNAPCTTPLILTHQWIDRRVKRSISYIFESIRLVEDMTVLVNSVVEVLAECIIFCFWFLFTILASQWKRESGVRLVNYQIKGCCPPCTGLHGPLPGSWIWMRFLQSPSHRQSLWVEQSLSWIHSVSKGSQSLLELVDHLLLSQFLNSSCSLDHSMDGYIQLGLRCMF